MSNFEEPGAKIPHAGIRAGAAGQLAVLPRRLKPIRRALSLNVRAEMSEVSKIIGYSGLDLFEDCYGYNEDACYIADTEASARNFMEYASFDGKYRIEPVTLARIMDDFGCSLGKFAMEKNTFARFRAAANKAGIPFKSCDLEDYDDLTLVNIE